MYSWIWVKARLTMLFSDNLNVGESSTPLDLPESRRCKFGTWSINPQASGPLEPPAGPCTGLMSYISYYFVDLSIIHRLRGFLGREIYLNEFQTPKIKCVLTKKWGHWSPLVTNKGPILGHKNSTIRSKGPTDGPHGPLLGHKGPLIIF